MAFSFISNTIVRRIARRIAHRIARLVMVVLAAAMLAVAASAQTSANNSGDNKSPETRPAMNAGPSATGGNSSGLPAADASHNNAETGATTAEPGGPNVRPAAPAGLSKVKLEPCEIPSLKITAQCGKYEVYEDREAKSGRKIALNILVLPALTATPKPDPVFYFEGGPGGSAVATAKSPGLKGIFDKWRAERDIVFVDQRGTGDSNPLRCDLPDPDDMTQYFSADKGLGRMGPLSECRERLSKVANLAMYTTSIAMDDLDEVRQAMGYDKINLFGGSYGTRAALVYIRQHGDHVRSAIMDGVAPTNFKFPLPFSKGVQNALETLFADCAADSACHKAFPDVEADLKSSLERFDKGPVTVTAFNIIKKQPQQITMNRAAFMDLVRMMLYQPQMTSLLPILLHQSAEGDFGGIASRGFIVAHQMAEIIANGMSLSVDCAEDAPLISEADIKQATDGMFYGDNRARAMLANCKEWPRGKVPAGYSDPVQSDVPVLIISGDVDPVTPPWLAADTASHLPHSKQIIGKSWSHSSMSPCSNQMMADFISKATTDGLVTECMQAGSRPAFNTGAVAFAPKDHAAGTVKTSYEGTIEAGKQKVRLGLNLFKEPNGKLSASLDVPDEGASGVAVDVVTLNEGALHFEMKQQGISYDGKMNQDGSEIDGVFKQGAEIPLTLKKKP